MANNMKNNFGQALYDMLGIGTPGSSGEAKSGAAEESRAETKRFDVESFSDNQAQPAPDADSSHKEDMDMADTNNYYPSPRAPFSPDSYTDLRVEKAVEVHSFEGTYLAAGTMMVGNLTARGDVEVAGEFEGAIVAKGRVSLHSNINSNVSATGLVLMGCNLVGDVDVSGTVEVDEQSSITGNVHAESMICSGTIKGDLDIQDSLTLDGNAQIDGNIKVDSMSMARGAKIAGKIEMQNLKKS